MVQLDEKFLEQVGLGELPEEQIKPFLQHIYEELELRVGTRLSDGMNKEQLDEFGFIIDRNDDIIVSWLEKHASNYYNDDGFLKLQKVSNLDVNDSGLRAEYTATKWLEVNRPDYRSVVASVLDDLKAEIISNKEVIIGKASS